MARTREKPDGTEEKSPIRPFPEAITRADDLNKDKNWKIVDSNASVESILAPSLKRNPMCGIGSTNIKDGIMEVPLDDAENSAAIRFHELKHVKWSPECYTAKETMGLSQASLQVAEDLRLGLLSSYYDVKQIPALKSLQARGIIRKIAGKKDRSVYQILVAMGAILSDSGIETDAKRTNKDVVHCCAHYISGRLESGNQRPYASALSELRKIDDELAREIRDELDNIIRRAIASSSPMDKGITLRIAREFEKIRIKEEKGKEASRRASESMKSIKASTSPEADSGMTRQEFEKLFQKAMEKFSPSSGSGGKDSDNGEERVSRTTAKWERMDKTPAPVFAEDETAGWGKMFIEKPPLKRQSRARLKYFAPNAAISGIIPKFVSRIVSSGKIFSKKGVPAPGGTIILDGSGSMRHSIHPQSIRDLLNAAPAATIAVYGGYLTDEQVDQRIKSGEFDPKKDIYGNFGTLKVLCRNGKLVEDEEIDKEFSRGANCVDGPAVAWGIANGQEPRFWVSDGCVSGSFERASPMIHSDIARLQIMGRVKRVDTMEDMIKIVRDRNKKFGLPGA